MPRPLSDKITQTTLTTQEADGATIRSQACMVYSRNHSLSVYLSKLQSVHNVCRGDWVLYNSLHFMSLIPCLHAFWRGAIPNLHIQ